MMDGFEATDGDLLPQPRRRAIVLALPRPRLPLRWALLVGLPLLALVIAALGTGFNYHAATFAPPPPEQPPATSAVALRKEAGKLRSERRTLESKLKQKAPRGAYLIIDQTHNRLVLKKDDQVLREAKCSAGSGMILQEGGGKNRKWVFDTPRGQFRVLNRISDPIWKKPDWAFIEEGMPIPKDPEERFERGTLGEYALYFGNGYMIHGTLYERLLGRSVTHGCIRLGREDLRVVWANTPIGTPIFIY